MQNEIAAQALKDLIARWRLASPRQEKTQAYFILNELEMKLLPILMQGTSAVSRQYPKITNGVAQPETVERERHGDKMRDEIEHAMDAGRIKALIARWRDAAGQYRGNAARSFQNNDAHAVRAHVESARVAGYLADELEAAACGAVVPMPGFYFPEADKLNSDPQRKIVEVNGLRLEDAADVGPGIIRYALCDVTEETHDSGDIGPISVPDGATAPTTLGPAGSDFRIEDVAYMEHDPNGYFS